MILIEYHTISSSAVTFVNNPFISIYGHPTAVVLQRLFDFGTTVYGTGKSGTVVLTTNGQAYAFSTDLALVLADAGS